MEDFDLRAYLASFDPSTPPDHFIVVMSSGEQIVGRRAQVEAENALISTEQGERRISLGEIDGIRIPLEPTPGPE